MAKRRKPIVIYPHEREAPVALYLRRRITLEGYENRPDDQQSFIEEWHKLTGRKDAWGEILHYMRNERKNSKWVKFNGTNLRSIPAPELTAEDTEALVDAYFLHVTLHADGSDNLGYDDEQLKIVAKQFSKATGKIIPRHDLNAKLTALRKRGLLTKVADYAYGEADRGFDDIDEAAGQ